MINNNRKKFNDKKQTNEQALEACNTTRYYVRGHLWLTQFSRSMRNTRQIRMTASLRAITEYVVKKNNISNLLAYLSCLNFPPRFPSAGAH